MANDKQKFILKRDEFVSHFLSPIADITDSVSLLASPEGTQVICNNENNIILCGQFTGAVSESPVKINIYGVKKFIQLMNCLNEEKIFLTIDDSTFSYKSDSLKFKYHLAEDNMMTMVKMSREKIDKMTYDCTFTISKDKIKELLTFSSVVASEKLYFLVKEGKVTAELADHQNPNTDSVNKVLTEVFQGSEVLTPMPISLDVFRKLNCIKFDTIAVKINTQYKVLLFEVTNHVSQLRYIVSSLVK